MLIDSPLCVLFTVGSGKTEFSRSNSNSFAHTLSSKFPEQAHLASNPICPDPESFHLIMADFRGLGARGKQGGETVATAATTPPPMALFGKPKSSSGVRAPNLADFFLFCCCC
jgi:hypothetical protein